VLSVPGYNSEPLVELLDRIERRYEEIFARRPSTESDTTAPIHEQFQERARGFKKAADLVVQSIIKDYNAFNYEMLPASVFLYRHSVELNLKSIRIQLAARVSSSYRFAKRHELIDLWNPIETYLKEAGFQFEEGHVHYRISRAVGELAQIDRDGQLFRYPDSNSPAAFDWIRVSLDNLRLAATEVDLLAFGFGELMSWIESARDHEPRDGGG
jgi:hypothetical protein